MGKGTPRPDQKIVRDVSRLSGKPLTETITPSSLDISTVSIVATTTLNEGAANGDLDGGEALEKWMTSSDLMEGGLPYTPDIIERMMEFSLRNPNKSSPHLFRADVLYDSLGVIKTPREREESSSGIGSGVTTCAGEERNGYRRDGEGAVSLPARHVAGFTLKRTVVRNLIPRNVVRDRRLHQTCHFYEGGCGRLLVIFTPHIQSKEDLPWYHPAIRSLAFLYEYSHGTASRDMRDNDESLGHGTMSLHFLTFPTEPITTRLERTLLSLMNTHVRLARGSAGSSLPPSSESGSYNPDKDNIIPQHLIQDTYTRLKLRYAADLCSRWVEETEPSKHVFEDLSIAAFLIELWRMMYGIKPAVEMYNEAAMSGQRQNDGLSGKGNFPDGLAGTGNFPGFVDVACGNGVLVYLLSMEGYKGWAFDARRRKTWKIFPAWIQDRLKEVVCIPMPFVDALKESGDGQLLQAQELGVEFHRGIFPENTFVISNHADELTAWTPLMTALSSPTSPLPFLAIPCCSHSLSGARCRYPPPKLKEKAADPSTLEDATDAHPANGDLKALRAEKKQQSHSVEGLAKSRYGSVMFKTMELAEEVGYEVEKTLLRIPSTRNMAIIGGRRRVTQAWSNISRQDVVDEIDADEEMAVRVTAKVGEVVRRECVKDGGVAAAAKIWLERAKTLHVGQGMGNQREHKQLNYRGRFPCPRYV